MSLDVATLRRIAKLARIRVDDATLARLGGELGTIIQWVEQLDEVDIEGVAPMTAPLAATLRLRADQVTDGGRRADILANAPDHQGPYFTVPKVVE